MALKITFFRISKNKKLHFFLMSPGSLQPKIRFLGQKMWSEAHLQTHRQTGRQTDRQTDTKVNTEDTLSGFQEFFLQPIIKDRSNEWITKMLNWVMITSMLLSPGNWYMETNIIFQGEDWSYRQFSMILTQSEEFIYYYSLCMCFVWSLFNGGSSPSGDPKEKARFQV